ncbi:MAG: hypothetical protein MI923_08950 [Phycisphaerales bacterium]|nr:hypothetical protein [Phycisphaerales bacterium]
MRILIFFEQGCCVSMRAELVSRRPDRYDLNPITSIETQHLAVHAFVVNTLES